MNRLHSPTRRERKSGLGKTWEGGGLRKYCGHRADKTCRQGWVQWILGSVVETYAQTLSSNFCLVLRRGHEHRCTGGTLSLNPLPPPLWDPPGDTEGQPVRCSGRRGRVEVRPGRSGVAAALHSSGDFSPGCLFPPSAEPSPAHRAHTPAPSCCLLCPFRLGAAPPLHR